MKEYEWQMTVYAELFKRKNGVYPKQAILYFLNELDVNPVPTKRPLRAVHTVNFNQGNVDRALSEFDATADEIIQCNTQRSEERRVGKEGVSTGRSGWWGGQ